MKRSVGPPISSNHRKRCVNECSIASRKTSLPLGEVEQAECENNAGGRRRYILVQLDGMVVGSESGLVLVLKLETHFSFIYQILYCSLKIRTSHLRVSICLYDFPNTVFAPFRVIIVS